MKRFVALTTIALIATLLVSLARDAHGETFGPLLKAHTAEAGTRLAWRHQTIHFTPGEADYNIESASVALRYGLSPHATLSAEIMRGSEQFTNDDTDLRYYVLGGGVQTLLWQRGDYLLSAVLQYTETMFFSKTGEFTDYRTQRGVGALFIERTLGRDNRCLTLWGGPAYALTSLQHIPSNGSYSRTGHSRRNSAVVAGFDAVLWGHVRLTYHVMVGEFFQDGGGVSYLFR